ncbi:hypothetical protein [Gluconacetobacter tumulicola]|uniref:Uncharacterized protein n=1 Tax=Gluconacetobacter tumulicola TaxID=1017177 RepID=A0A7W4JGZ4_9PROT|nr:hypothetical protein [Gluconacetobacter tumulicola]MBB2181105.1 hypothetical protein [Gluconacetobacter tumulicola]
MQLEQLRDVRNLPDMPIIVTIDEAETQDRPVEATLTQQLLGRDLAGGIIAFPRDVIDFQ